MARDRMNLEWKGRLLAPGPDYERLALQLAKAANSEIPGPENSSGRQSIRWGEELWQQDTYFPCLGARLKLRQVRDSHAELIWYHRPDDSSIRLCHYRRLEIKDPIAVRAGLEATLGIETQVIKTRTLYWWQNVRIHLDRVGNLGDFVEFEAVLNGSEQLARGEQQLAALQNWLQLDASQAIATSYRNLMIESGINSNARTV